MPQSCEKVNVLTKNFYFSILEKKMSIQASLLRITEQEIWFGKKNFISYRILFPAMIIDLKILAFEKKSLKTIVPENVMLETEKCECF